MGSCLGVRAVGPVAQRRMGDATAVGTAMSLRCVFAALIGWLVAVPCMAGDNFALIVSGAAGGEAYAKKYDGWRTSMVGALKSSGYADDHVVALSNATRDQIQLALQQLQP